MPAAYLRTELSKFSVDGFAVYVDVRPCKRFPCGAMRVYLSAPTGGQYAMCYGIGALTTLAANNGLSSIGTLPSFLLGTPPRRIAYRASPATAPMVGRPSGVALHYRGLIGPEEFEFEIVLDFVVD
jgi:hypothetical protein